MRRRLTVVSVVAALAAQAAAIAGMSSIDTLLRAHFHFSAAQIAEVHRGRPISTSIAGSMDREMVAVGAVRIDAPPERLLEVMRDIQKFESGSGFLQTANALQELWNCKKKQERL